MPSRRQALVFAFKCRVLQALRWKEDVRSGLKRHPVFSLGEFVHVVEHRSRLWKTEDPAEKALELGKVHNLRVAGAKLNGSMIPAGETFSFWKQVGRATKRRGFVDGRELQEGCIVPGVGGGLCQLSNALYSLAMQAGFEIVERHPHTQAVPGSEAEHGRDATVAWNHIDLRFRSTADLQIRVSLTRDELVVRFASSAQFGAAKAHRTMLKVLQSSVGSCETCGADGCFRHNTGAAVEARSGLECQAFLLDAVWPEFQKLLDKQAVNGDALFLPLDGKRAWLERYAWSIPEGVELKSASLAAVKRTINARKKLAPPEKRRLALQDTDRVAQELGRLIPFNAKQVTVDIGYCAELCRKGCFGGRDYAIWFTRLPLKLMHLLLDNAKTKLPESTTIGDFRAPEQQVEDEWNAILGAAKLVTPHPFLADWLRSHTSVEVELIDWVMPSVVPGEKSDGVFFPGPTVAREGAYAVREAARALGLTVGGAGKNLEGEGFWDGVAVDSERKLSNADTVVIPAVFHNRPVAGLKAMAMGKRVIATAECGIPGAEVIPFGDAEALIQRLS